MGANYRVDPTNGRITHWNTDDGSPILYPLHEGECHGGSLLCFPFGKQPDCPYFAPLGDIPSYGRIGQAFDADNTSFRQDRRAKTTTFTRHESSWWPAVFQQQTLERRRESVSVLEHSFSLLHKETGKGTMPVNFGSLFYFGTHGQNFTLRDEHGVELNWTEFEEGAEPDYWPTKSSYLELHVVPGVIRIENMRHYETWAVFTTNVSRYLAIALVHPGNWPEGQHVLEPNQGINAQARITFAAR